jgi:hypothetical protein
MAENQKFQQIVFNGWVCLENIGLEWLAGIQRGHSKIFPLLEWGKLLKGVFFWETG